MILSINQPAYLPWLGYFDRIAASDMHVVLDHVQFEKNSFTNRNRIRSPQGSTWLTIPVATSGQFGDLAIHSLRMSDGGRWRKKHLATLKANYGRAAHFADRFKDLSTIYLTNTEEMRVLPVMQELIDYQLARLGISTARVSSSSLDLSARKSDLVLEICSKLGASTYLSGPLGRDYLDIQQFYDAGIDVKFHDYSPIEYEQLWPGFESHLAALDALMLMPGEKAREVMEAGRKIVPPGARN